MQLATHDGARAIADSFHAWWRDAGVDYLCSEESVDWLASPPGPVETVARGGAPAQPREVEAKPATTSAAAWPKDGPALIEAISANIGLPGTGYGRKAALPVIVDAAEHLVLLDFPEEEEIASGQLGTGRSGALLRAMLSAAGIDMARVQIGALAYTRPATGALPHSDMQSLAEFARHQVAISNANSLLLFGSAACEALLETDLMAARSNLPDFNQNGRNLPVVATFHPRTLLARPILKAQAWQDLQRIARKVRL